MEIDVYYVPCDIQGFHPSTAHVFRSWDGSLYIETNVKALAGARRRVQVLDSIIFISGIMINGGLSWYEKNMLMKME